jgi:hypothetical protein
VTAGRYADEKSKARGNREHHQRALLDLIADPPDGIIT